MKTVKKLLALLLTLALVLSLAACGQGDTGGKEDEDSPSQREDREDKDSEDKEDPDKGNKAPADLSPVGGGPQETEPIETEPEPIEYNISWEVMDGVLTISGTGPMPDYVDGRATPWFGNREEITSVVIEDGVTSIGAYGLATLYWASGVTIPETVTSIGAGSFQGWGDSFTSITIPGSVKSIGEMAFFSDDLQEIILSEGLESIGPMAFYANEDLTDITIPASVTSIGDGALAFCPSLKEIHLAEGNQNFVFEDGVLFSADRTKLLAYLPAIRRDEYTIPDSVTKIDNFAFYHSGDVTIHGKIGSAAERYAKENNIPFVAD